MKLWILGLAFALVVQTVPVEKVVERAVCTNRTQRKAWHSLTNDEKSTYISAEKCLMTKPAKLGLVGARTLFDELQLLHVYETPEIHGVGAFLPYHRYFVHAHEYLLKAECGYTGGQPYWDEALDAGNFSTSVVLDAQTGFGGNGQGPGNCIHDGPFKEYVNAVGPGKDMTDHCIDRIVSDCTSQMGNQTVVDGCMQMENYSTFWPCLEGGPHGAGHGGIGGQMLNVFSSPGDPLFYLHHTYLDKLWWDWQEKSLATRLTDISGRNVALFPPFTFPSPGNGTANGTFPGIPANGDCSGMFPPGGFPPAGFPGQFPGGPPSLMKRDGDPSNETTLAHVLTAYGAVPNATIADVMDIQAGILCYEYL